MNSLEETAWREFAASEESSTDARRQASNLPSNTPNKASVQLSSRVQLWVPSNLNQTAKAIDENDPPSAPSTSATSATATAGSLARNRSLEFGSMADLSLANQVSFGLQEDEEEMEKNAGLVVEDIVVVWRYLSKIVNTPTAGFSEYRSGSSLQATERLFLLRVAFSKLESLLGGNDIHAVTSGLNEQVEIIKTYEEALFELSQYTRAISP
eukprot:TRINITY_DN4769_c0_g2_i1.p1 TRINITY_DN4769_c0_g2~~TRINITY_DN4769_c0_g2_i1.p1  ORF type:complete len:211 (-),score=85.10 TRINITY_DN4769_c0_g2_i1:90-722(-)